MKRRGPNSVWYLGSAKFSNEGAYLFRKFAAFWGTNSVDHQARICHSTTVAGVANTWGYGAQTNSYNDIRNAKTIVFMGSNAAEAHPVSLQHVLTGKETNRANMIVFDPRLTRTAAHANEYVRFRSGTDIPVIWGMLHHIFENKWEDAKFIDQRVYGMDEVRAEVKKWDPKTVEDVTGIPGEQLKRVAEMFAKQRPSTFIWCMGGTQHTVGTANVRAYCTLLLATGNVGFPGTGANIFRGHCNVQGATDLGVDIGTLPLYYGLADPAWRHWSRVWEVEFDWLDGRFDKRTGRDGKPVNMRTMPGIPSTRWFDAAVLPKDQLDQKDNIKAAIIFGHGGNTVPRMPEMVKGLAALDLLVIADPHPTNFVSMGNRKNGTYLLPISTQLECDGSRTASNRSLQWGEKIVEPIFESANDYWVMYEFAKKLGFADRMFKNIRMVKGKFGDEPQAESILSEINRGGFSTGYCGQSPERLKAHMKNQDKFDIVTLKSLPGAPAEIAGDHYGLPWPCWGKPEHRHPGIAAALQHHARSQGRRRHLPPALRHRARDEDDCHGGRQAGREGDPDEPARQWRLLQGQRVDRWLSGVHAGDVEAAGLGQGPDAGRARRHQPDRWRQRGHRVVGDRPVGRYPARCHRTRLHALRQRQGPRRGVGPARPGAGASRADLLAARRPCRQVPDAAGLPALPFAQHRLLRAEGGGRQGHRQGVPDHPHLRSPRRVRGRRRGDALQQVAGRAAAGHVRRDQSVRTLARAASRRARWCG